MEKESSNRSEEPEHFFLRLIHREWPVIKKAPWSIGAIVLMCVGLSYFAMNFFYLRQLDTISEERDATNRENDKLRSRVSNLESRVPESNPYEWPPLSDEQISGWVSQLEPLKLKKLQVGWVPATNAQLLFRSIQKVGKRIGITVSAESVIGYSNDIEISVNERDSAIGRLLEKLFREADFPAKVVLEKNQEQGLVWIYIGDKP